MCCADDGSGSCATTTTTTSTTTTSTTTSTTTTACPTPAPCPSNFSAQVIGVDPVTGCTQFGTGCVILQILAQMYRGGNHPLLSVLLAAVNG